MSEDAVHIVKDYATLAIAAGAVFAPLCSLMVGLRFYARRIHRSGYGLDDWTILAALFFVIGMAVTLIVEISNRSDTPDTETGSLSTNLPEWIFELLQIPALGLVKASFLFLYQRIFATGITASTKRFWWWTTAMLVIIAAWTVAFFVAFILVCDTDPSAWWGDAAIAEGKCYDTIKLHNAFAISDMVTDVSIILLPIPEIWDLRLPLKSKFAVTGVFLLGAISTVMSAFRAGVYLNADHQNLDPTSDFDFFKTVGVYLSMLESGLGLIAACLPVLWTLLDSARVYHVVASIKTSVKAMRSRNSDERQRSSSISSKDPLRNGGRTRTNSGPLETQLFIGPSRIERKVGRGSRGPPRFGGIMVTQTINMTEQTMLEYGK